MGKRLVNDNRPYFTIGISNDSYSMKFTRRADEHVFIVGLNHRGRIATDDDLHTSSMFLSVKELVEQLDMFRDTKCRVTIDYRCIFKRFDVFDETFRVNKDQWFRLKGFNGPDRDTSANVYPTVWEFSINLRSKVDIRYCTGCR